MLVCSVHALTVDDSLGRTDYDLKSESFTELWGSLTKSAVHFIIQ